MELFSHPFRLLSNGRVATVTQGSAASDAEHVAMLLLTRVDERPLVPSFGIPDPQFNTLNEHDVIAAVGIFLPDVEVLSVTVEPTTQDRAARVQVELGGTSAEP